MFPRAIAKLPGSVRSRPLSTHKTFYYWGAAPGQCRTQDSRRCYSTRQGPSAGVVPPLPGSNITTTASTSLHPSLATAVLSAGEKDVERQETPVWRRFASTAATALVEDPVREDEDARYPPAVGLRPETAPASTPMDLGCKAYYMARTIDIRTVRSVRMVLVQCGLAVYCVRRSSGVWRLVCCHSHLVASRNRPFRNVSCSRVSCRQLADSPAVSCQTADHLDSVVLPVSRRLWVVLALLVFTL